MPITAPVCETRTPGRLPGSKLRRERAVMPYRARILLFLCGALLSVPPASGATLSLPENTALLLKVGATDCKGRSPLRRTRSQAPRGLPECERRADCPTDSSVAVASIFLAAIRAWRSTSRSVGSLAPSRRAIRSRRAEFPKYFQRGSLPVLDSEHRLAMLRCTTNILHRNRACAHARFS